MKIIKVPGDGHCFFHAVGLQTRYGAQQLRHICSELILNNFNKHFNGLLLKDWIFYETGLNHEVYANQIRLSKWAGALEMKLLSDYFNTSIAVYRPDGHNDGHNDGKLKKITEINPENMDMCSKYGIIFLLFNVNHYDAIM
jgi:hypothetical protein